MLGIIINHCKDPYETSSILESASFFLRGSYVNHIPETKVQKRDLRHSLAMIFGFSMGKKQTCFSIACKNRELPSWPPGPPGLSCVQLSAAFCIAVKRPDAEAHARLLALEARRILKLQKVDTPK